MSAQTIRNNRVKRSRIKDASMNAAQQPMQVRDISDSLPDGLQLALNRASEYGYYVRFMWPWGNNTRIVFNSHPDFTNPKLPSAEHLSQCWGGDVAEAPDDPAP